MRSNIQNDVPMESGGEDWSVTLETWGDGLVQGLDDPNA